MKEIKRELISSSNKTILCPNIIYNKEIQNGKLVCFTILNFLLSIKIKRFNFV